MLNDPRTAMAAMRFAQGLVGDVAQIAQAATRAAKSGAEQAHSTLGETFAEVLSGAADASDTPATIDVEDLSERLLSLLQSVGVPGDFGSLRLTLGHGDRVRVDADGQSASFGEANVEQWINSDQFGALRDELRRWLQANPGQPFVLQSGGNGGQS